MRTRFACSFALVLTMACAHKPEAKSEPVAEPAPAPVAPVEPAQPAEQRSCSQDGDCGARQLCVQSRCADITPEMAECRQVEVSFAFDRSELDSDARSSLQRVARCLQANSATQVVIEGNADERGTAEYNLALGDRRANTVDKYLVSLGVPSGKTKTVSYGKERPVCAEHTEECWAKNRRAILKSQ